LGIQCLLCQPDNHLPKGTLLHQLESHLLLLLLLLTLAQGVSHPASSVWA
jgi:hypothetical protein